MMMEPEDELGSLAGAAAGWDGTVASTTLRELVDVVLNPPELKAFILNRSVVPTAVAGGKAVTTKLLSEGLFLTSAEWTSE